MEETEPQKTRPTVAKSSINRKPLLNLTNIVRKPYQSKKRPAGSSPASDSSIGSTQNPNHVPADQFLPSTRPILTPDHLVGCENRIAHAQRGSTLKTRSKTKADGTFYQTSIEETWSNDKINDQGKGNMSSLVKMTNDAKEMLPILPSPSMKKIMDKRKAIDVPFSSHHTRSAKNSIDAPIPHFTSEIKDKGKESVVQSSYSSTGNTKHTIASKMTNTLIKRNDKGKVAVPEYQTSVKETRSNGKEGSVPLCSSTIENTKDQVKGNQSSLHTMTNDGKEIFVAPHCSSIEMIKNKRKAIDVPFSAHQMKNVKNNTDCSVPHSTLKIKDQRKEDTVAVRSSYPLMENTNINVASTMPHSLMKGMDKGKGIAVPRDCAPMNNVKNKTVEVCAPLSGVHIKDRGETVAGSSRVGLYQKDKGKAVATPINYHSLETANAIPLSGVIIKDNGKTVSGSSRVDLTQKDEGKAVSTPPLNNVKNKMVEVCAPLSGVHIKDRGETVAGSSRAGPSKKDKGKAVSTPINYHSLERANAIPLYGVIIKDKGETVSGFSHDDPAQKDEGKGVATPINSRTPEKKKKGTSCPPLLKTTRNRNEADGVRHTSKSKLQTEPPNKKKRCSSSKGSDEKYALPQDFVEQQRAYFKEIDDFELEVEEV